MGYCLRQIEHGNPYPLKIDLDEDIVIGSDSNHTLNRYPLVSPCHAHFVRKRGGWSVRDLDSTHGTFVNSYRIGAILQKLQLGDQIGFGAKCFTDGFICALDFKKPEKKTPEVIDLIHDTPVKVEPPDDGARGDVNVHWNGPSTSSAGRLERYNSHQCNVSYIADENVQLRDCFVPLVRCDSEHFKFPPDVRKVNMRNGAFEIKAVDDNVSHRQFEPHTNMNIIGESSTDCRSNLDPYKMLKKCYISLVRCDSALFSVPYDLQPFSGDKKKLIPIMTKSRCTDTSYGVPSEFLTENEKPKKSIENVRILEKGVNSVLGLVNRRRIVSSDSSDSDTSDFSNNRFDQRKTSISLDTTGSVHRVAGKRANEIVSKSSLDIPIVPSSVSEAPQEPEEYQEKVRIFENRVSSVLGLVNRRRIVSSDSSDSDTPDFSNNKFDQRKTSMSLDTTCSVHRVAGKRANEIIPKSGLNIPIAPPSVSEAPQSTINLQSLFSDVFSSCDHHQQGIKLNSAKSKQISGNNDKQSFIESENASLGYSQEEEDMIVSDVEESYVGQKPFPAANHDSLTNYDLNELKILENIRNTIRSQIRDYNQLPSSKFSSDAAENIDCSVNISSNLDKHPLFDCSTLKRQSRLDGLPPLDDSYINSVTNHVGVLEEHHYSLNESVKKQETAGCESSPDREYHSDSSVASMDYIITASIGKTGLDSSEEKKNFSFDSPEIEKNVQHDLLNSTKSNYLALLNSSENAHVVSSEGKNSLDSSEIRKNLKHDSSNRTKSNYLAVLNSFENAHVDSSEGKNGLDSSEIKKNVQHDLSNRTKNNYLALLNSSEDDYVDSSEDKSSAKNTRRTLPIEALPLHRHSKKFNREEKQPWRKRASQIPSPNSNFFKRKHSPVALSAKMPNGIMPASSFKIPKVSKPPQQKKGGQKDPFISKQNKTTKIVNCSSLSDEKSFSISRNPKNTSGFQRRFADMGTKDFKKRPKRKDVPLTNKVTGMRESNDTSNSNKLISVPEITCNGLGNVGTNVGKIHDEDENDNIYNIPVIISNRIEEPCKTYSIVNSNLTVLSPPCNSFLTAEGLTSSKNSLNCSDPSSFRSFSLEQTLSNSKDANENLISSTKEANEVSPNASTSSIVHEFAELIRRTISAAQTSSVDNVIPCTSVSGIRDIVAVTPVPSTSKKLNAVDFDVPKSPRNIGSLKTNVPAGPSSVLVANTFSDNSTSKFNLDAVHTDPRIKLTIPCAEQLSFTHQALHSSESPVKQVFSSNEYNSPSYAPKVNKLLSSSKTGIENLAFVTNSQVALASPTSDQLSCVNKRLTSNVFNRTPSVPEVKLVAIPESESNSTADLPSVRPNVASSCPDQLPRVQQRLSSTESIGKPNSVVISYLRMIKNVVSLNLKWLEEQTNNNKPPPEVSKGAAPLPLFFSSFDQYVSAFVPMLMLEIWKKMFDEYKMICEDALLSKEFGFIILSHKNELEMSEYNCEAVVDKRTFEPCEGNLVIMHIDDIKSNCYQILCYIHVHKTEKLSIVNLNPEWNKVHNMQTENLMLCKFSVYAKLRPMMPLVNKKMKGNGICFIKNKLMLADALQKLETSPLCPSVLCPQMDVFSVNRDTSVDSQEAVVESLSNELRKPIATPKILLLRGPPGTGKSYIIVTLLQKLIHKERAKVKILLTAPSDVAVDEIGCRLIKKKLNFVRFGSLHFINERIRPFTLAAKAEKLKEESIRKTEQRKERLEKLLTEIAVMKITDSKCEKKLRPLVKEKLALEKKIFMATNVDTSHRNYRHEALRDADVILTSLGECGDSLMSVFKPNTPLAFTCCIVDHASQCTEMDILPALAFGMSKLVVVGDPVQLTPMVHSKWTAQYGYEKSMFERFHHYFSEHTGVSPSLTLEKQFRMHSEICFFPSKQFYNNGLKTPPDVDVRYVSFPFHPYIVYDISERQGPKLTSSSEHCADFILTICNQLLLLKKLTFSIGILVPTREDRKIFSKKLLKQKALLKHVEVNTVEGFQGREKDMVLMSCGSSSGIGRSNFLSCDRRFNVALTRARKCLIVCIGSSTLKQTPFWQNLIRDATDRHLYSPAISIKDITLTFLPTMLKQI